MVITRSLTSAQENEVRWREGKIVERKVVLKKQGMGGGGRAGGEQKTKQKKEVLARMAWKKMTSMQIASEAPPVAFVARASSALL